MTDFDWNFDSAPATGADPLSDGIDILGILRRRKWIVIATTILSTLLGILWYSRAEPVYQATAQVQIERKRPAGLPIMGADVTTQRAMLADAFKHPIVMRSPEMVGKAVRESKLGELKMFGGGIPTGKIIRGLDVDPVTEGLGIYNVSFKGSDKDEVGEVADAIIQAYQNELEFTHRATSDETRSLITRMKEELLQQLSAQERAYSEFKQKAPLIWKDGATTNVHQERQLALENRRYEIKLQITELQTKLDAVQSAIRRGDNPESLLVSFTPPDFSAPPASQARNATRRQVNEEQMLPLLLEEEELVSRFGKDHPRVKSIRRRIQYSQKFMKVQQAKYDKEAANSPIESFPTWNREEAIQKALATYVNHLNQSLEQLQKQRDELDAEFQREADAAKGLTQYLAEDRRFQNDLSRKQQLFDVVVKRFEEISLVKDDEGYNFRTLAKAGIGRKVEPNLLKALGVSTALGMLAGCLFAYLVDLSDKSFHSPVEVSQQLGVPVVGHIPLLRLSETQPTGDLAEIAPIVCTLHNSKSQHAEAYRTVRNTLFFNARGQRHQVIQLTSPRPSDGKSTLAANLAVAIANSGKTTLLIDADFRRPTQHKIFGLSSQVGLASVVAGAMEPTEAYQNLKVVPNLTIMACGPRPANPAELLSSAGFQSTLEYLREQFDFVIVDTPPLLAVSDPAAIAGQVDGVLLTMRVDKQAKPVSRRAIEILREVGAEIAGIVINGIGDRNNPGYHAAGNYHYGYAAEKYGYGYQYAYEDN